MDFILINIYFDSNVKRKLGQLFWSQFFLKGEYLAEYKVLSKSNFNIYLLMISPTAKRFLSFEQQWMFIGLSLPKPAFFCLYHVINRPWGKNF